MTRRTPLTAEQIAVRVEHLDGLAERRAVLALYRKQDGVSLVNRAWRRLNALEQANGAYGGLEYCHMLEGAMSDIVNAP